MSNQTLHDLLTARVAEFSASDRPREIIDAAVEAMFKDIIKDAFRSYGDMGKAVGAKLVIDCDQYDFSYDIYD